MNKILVDSGINSVRIGFIEKGELIEYIYEEKNKKSLVGNIYVGVVTNVHKGMEACFIDIGQEKNAYMSVSKGDGIKQNDHILVKVEKDANQTKGAVVTSKISIAGNFIILIPNENGSIGISKKIADSEERNRIKAIVEKHLPQGYGIIIRTEAKGQSEEEFINEIEKAFKECETIINKSKFIKGPVVVYENESFALKTIRDLLGYNIDEIIVNDEKEYNIIKEKIGHLNTKIIFYNNRVPLFENYFVESQSEKAMHKKIWLKSGGFLIIEETEACVIIDVNTGKFTGGRSFQSTIFKTNKEAAIEVAKQLRLRNLSGMIIIDFIDIQDGEKRIELKNILEDEVRKDRIKTNVVGITELGLMQVTRKKTSLSLSKKIAVECKNCLGTGQVYSYEHITDKVVRNIKSMFTDTMYNKIILSSNRYLLKNFAGYKNANVKLLEKEMGKIIVLNEIETGAQDYFELKGE